MLGEQYIKVNDRQTDRRTDDLR